MARRGGQGRQTAETEQGQPWGAQSKAGESGNEWGERTKKTTRPRKGGKVSRLFRCLELGPACVQVVR